MELKPYQQQVIDDLALFLEHLQSAKDTSKAFTDFWTYHPRTPLTPFTKTAIEPYKNNVKRTPHVCMKVPTAGGKTFIACNALKTIFDAFGKEKTKAVVWLVPSVTILEQTIKNLRNPEHPYRRKINTHFGNRVEVFEKNELLQGGGFNATSVNEQLSIMVLSFDSLRARNKEDRKVHQENGNLQSFENLLGKDVDISLSDVIKHLNPVVIVDESHNAESELSVEMLGNLNPSFILDLTATPRKNSNIISFIDALELKKENMVKLPVIVYNHQDKTSVIDTSLQLQKRLEQQAIEEEKQGGKYIRPIVLFQVQPKNAKDNWSEDEEKSNVQKLKEKLLELQIPEQQIKIKTANINEIKGIDLMSKDCEVRYIITINALKEGWDCPFAYILASLADKSSAVDVEQILGRVLRQPHVRKHKHFELNLSYVLTASSKFLDTLDNIVAGLNKAGFSDKDFRATDITQAEQPINPISTPQPITFPEDDITADIDIARISATNDTIPSQTIAEIEKIAHQQSEELEKTITEIETNKNVVLPPEIQSLVNTYKIKDTFSNIAQEVKLPQFYLKVSGNHLFGNNEDVLLEKENLLDGFQLGKCDTHIDFDNADTEIYKVDLDETTKDNTPIFLKLDNTVKENLFKYILDPAKKENRVRNLSSRIMATIGNMYPISDGEIRKYVTKILDDFTDDQFNDFGNNEYSYVDKIKRKINQLSDKFAEEQFTLYLDSDKIIVKPNYTLPTTIIPSGTAKAFPKSLYEKEAGMNDFEEKVINEIANMENIVFWSRNIERKGFCINGFINHYPDFIIQTKSGKTILLETKGDHLIAKSKIKLGDLWKSKAGNNYRYFLVYNQQNIDGAYTLTNFLKTIKTI